jgi:hypothetical protein
MLQRTVDYPCLILLIFCWYLMESVIKCLYFSFWWQMLFRCEWLGTKMWKVLCYLLEGQLQFLTGVYM